MPCIGFSGELYPSGTVRKYQQFESLESDATGGGFAVFQGGRPWRIVMAKVTKNNMDVGISYLQLFSPMGNEYFAEMAITISLGGGDASLQTYFSGEPCAPGVDALIKLNKGAGKSDNCLTIKPLTVTIQGKSVPTMSIQVRNSQSSKRLYDINLLLALDKLGFPNSKDADWTTSQISNDAPKMQFIKKIGAWGEQLQDAVNLALAFSKPQDVFQKVPSIDTLLPPEPKPSVQQSQLPATLVAQVTEYGLYKRGVEKIYADPSSPSGQSRSSTGFRLIASTQDVPLELGASFGFCYKISGYPAGAEPKVVVVADHPAFSQPDAQPTTRHDFVRHLVPVNGVLSDCSGYEFDHPYELVPGNWNFSVVVDGNTLLTQSFITQGAK
jgi:hypothetical protein